MPRSQFQPQAELAALRREADKCVKCALCAPHCPTYLVSLDENESPRGRIALIQGVAGGQLRLDGALRRHLDRCTGCRACEKVCPSGVRYGQLLDGARRLAPVRQPVAWRLLRGLLAGPRRRALLHLGARLLRGAGMAARLGLPPRADRRTGGGTAAPSATPARERVILFAGCTGRLLDHNALAAARTVLARLGCDVLIPHPADCCGALHAHDGDSDTALHLARRILRRYGTGRDAHTTLVYLATGCGAHMQEYAQLPWEDAEERQRAAAFAARVTELGDFLLPRLREAKLPLAPLAATLYVHEPCSQRNVLRNGDTTHRLLALIPGAEVRALPDNEHCCGGAGSYVWTQADTSRAIFARKRVAIEAHMPWPREVISTNPGCATLFRRAGVDVRHPVEVIAAQLGD